MYQVWVNNEDPVQYLVQEVGAAKPAFFDSAVWSSVGEVKVVDPKLLPEIRESGFSVVERIGVAFNPDEVFG